MELKYNRELGRWEKWKLRWLRVVPKNWYATNQVEYNLWRLEQWADAVVQYEQSISGTTDYMRGANNKNSPSLEGLGDIPRSANQSIQKF